MTPTLPLVVPARYRHPDDEYVDEVKIGTAHRWKDSEISGSEWRRSSTLLFLRKGHVVFQRDFRALSHAVEASPWFKLIWDEEPGFRALSAEVERSLCQQPGCQRPPSPRIYQLGKRQISRQHDVLVGIPADRPVLTWWCEAHERRGDCGLEDRDDNWSPFLGLTIAFGSRADIELYGLKSDAEPTERGFTRTREGRLLDLQRVGVRGAVVVDASGARFTTLGEPTPLRATDRFIGLDSRFASEDDVERLCCLDVAPTDAEQVEGRRRWIPRCTLAIGPHAEHHDLSTGARWPRETEEAAK